jgi:uncharacterized membrane protein
VSLAFQNVTAHVSYEGMTKRLVSFLFLFAFLFPLTAFAHMPHWEETVVVTRVLQEEVLENGNTHYLLEIEAEQGPTQVRTQDSFELGVVFDIEAGEKILVEYFWGSEEGAEIQVFFKDVIRIQALLWIALLFMLVTIAVGWGRGALALTGLATTLGILFLFVFPQILAGGNPVLYTTIGAIVIMAINMPIAHGFKKQTIYAFLSTVIGLLFVLLFTTVFVKAAQLSGLSSEDAVLLYWDVQTIKLPVGILMAGIILGATGVLDDIAITQAQVVHELTEANPKITKKHLFTQAMKVGRHHIASTINTLVLVYAGAALPVLLLFIHYSVGIGEFLNSEIVAEEIVRTLAGTTALVLTVPISTWFATLVYKQKSK